MRFYKNFLIGFIILLLSVNQRVSAMESDDPISPAVARTVNLPDEIQAYILSFLEQNNLLRAVHVSKTWRQAAEEIWKNKSLNLSNWELNTEDYKSLVQGPFSCLILQTVNLGEEEVEILSCSSKFIRLDLGRNRIGNEGADKIFAAPFPLLTALNLSSTGIGVTGTDKISSAHFPLLTTLDLSSNNIGDERKAELKERFGKGVTF